MEVLKTVNFLIALIFAVCYSYQFIYIPLSFFIRPKVSGRVKKNKFAVLICARNEEKVIGGLLDSINRQTYDRSLIKTFVIADNCTDNTAATAKAAGAVVYERYNKTKIGKGYALEELLRHIKEDYGSEFDGYFVFDADNILEPDFIEEMNKTFSDGYEIVTSFRNSKNYGTNWISAGYALWFMRESRFLNWPRAALGVSCAVSGTGFLVGRRIMEKNDGWRYHLLTEDIEFSVSQIIEGEKIGYCSSAVLYDEQPVKFRQSWRQRMRWAKGYLQVFRKYGAKMLRGTLKGSFSCFDMSMSIIPAFVLTCVAIAANVSLAVLGAVRGDNVMIAVESLVHCLFDAYILMYVLGLITTITEWKNIHAQPWKKILYTFTFPIFTFTYIPISVAALFARVTWKPIEHNHAVSLRDIKATGEK